MEKEYFKKFLDLDGGNESLIAYDHLPFIISEEEGGGLVPGAGKERPGQGKALQADSPDLAAPPQAASRGAGNQGPDDSHQGHGSRGHAGPGQNDQSQPAAGGEHRQKIS